MNIPSYMDEEKVVAHFKKATEFFLLNGEAVLSRMQLEESSANTYRDHLRLYIYPFIKKNGITIDVLHKYKLHLNTQRCKGSGANYRFTVFRRFIKRLQDENILWFDICAGVRIPKKERRQQKMMSRADVDKLINFLENVQPGMKNYRYLIRLKAMTLLMLLQGSRSVEVRKCLVEDFDSYRGVILVKRKGNTGVRELKLVAPVVEAISEYIDVWGLKSGFMFPATFGPNKGKPMTRDGFIKRYTSENGLFALAGVSQNTASPHSFRRFHITLLYRYFKDPVKVAQHMGLTVGTVLMYIAQDDAEELSREANDTVETMYAHQARMIRYENKINQE